MRRVATVLSGSACWRLWPDLRQPFLRRPPVGGLCAVQFRDPGDGDNSSKTSATPCTRWPTPGVTTPSWSPISAFPPRPVCLSGCCRMRSMGSGSSASTSRASECRPMPRPRMSSPGDAQLCPTGGGGPVQFRPLSRVNQTVRQSRCWAKMFPADPLGIGGMLAPLGLAAGPVVPCREWRELYSALDSQVVAAIHPFYTAAVREFEAAGRTIVGSAPRRT